MAAALWLLLCFGCGDDARYDPCEEVACGEQCLLCDPDDPDCEETSVVKLCNSEGICSAQPTTCQQGTSE